MSDQKDDYFSNHQLKLKFPWRLYHGPIIQALQAVVDQKPDAQILNVGSGPFYELDLIQVKDQHFFICDVDERSVQMAKSLWGDRLLGAEVVKPDGRLPYDDQSMDLVVSMDVIEHVLQPVEWTKELLRVLKPGGRLFFTTPNYASTSFKLIENTALEAIARMQGFSRKQIHPTKMTPVRLTQVLSDAGAGEIEVSKLAFGWLLASQAVRTSR